MAPVDTSMMTLPALFKAFQIPTAVREDGDHEKESAGRSEDEEEKDRMAWVRTNPNVDLHAVPMVAWLGTSNGMEAMNGRALNASASDDKTTLSA